jgi:hypothetical protein
MISLIDIASRSVDAIGFWWRFALAYLRPPPDETRIWIWLEPRLAER